MLAEVKTSMTIATNNVVKRTCVFSFETIIIGTGIMEVLCIKVNSENTRPATKEERNEFLYGIKLNKEEK